MFSMRCSVLPSDRRLIVEVAVGVASVAPSSDEVGPRAIGRRPEFGSAHRNSNNRFLVGVISIKLLARDFCQPPLMGHFPQPIDSK